MHDSYSSLRLPHNRAPAVPTSPFMTVRAGDVGLIRHETTFRQGRQAFAWDVLHWHNVAIPMPVFTH